MLKSCLFHVRRAEISTKLLLKVRIALYEVSLNYLEVQNVNLARDKGDNIFFFDTASRNKLFDFIYLIINIPVD